MSELKFNCVHCGQRLQCDDRFSGTEIECPSCKKKIAVPGARSRTSGMTFVPETWKKPTVAPPESTDKP